eukprot:CAMPEP_0198124992 /NCGR_PEP_ID=MMETSP1442-20131203/41507_1 /TAXON_ID= /ORGANISM="Craspedostauros australis, Strain CCMP3328" /LENGTH=386 /DNA_ID=CAMNT_0043784517 /DNA_START=110 /DNA_END=1270 /DNA_ORIENTATION=+
MALVADTGATSSAATTADGTKQRRRVALAGVITVAVCGVALAMSGSGGSLMAARSAERPRLLSSGKDEDDCNSGDYRKRTLKLAYEVPMVSLFRDMKGQRKHEASDVIKVDDTIYAVCDSSWAIAKFSDTLPPLGWENTLMGDPRRESDDSGYEAIVHEAGTFYVIRESIQMTERDKFHAIIEELRDLSPKNYTISKQCPSEFEFEGDSKGFEGAIAVRDLDFEVVMLGLCEGNHCSEKKKSDKGHGRIVAMKKAYNSTDGSCEWKTIRTIKIPKSADFKDYSSITMDSMDRVAITSQEDSQLWIGNLNGKTPSGLWDIEAMDFDNDDYDLYDFPKNDQCMTVYCNIEGIHWINEHMLIAVSDKMKKSQDFRCFDKDQSVHVFTLP